MTIIAYRDGVIAADTQVMDGDIRMGRVTKIIKTDRRVLAGAAGPMSHCSRFMDWTQGCFSRPELVRIEGTPFLGFSVDRDGIIRAYEEELEGVVVSSPFFAIGSGAAVALGAFEMGATAEQAVRAAIKYDSGCGGEVEVLCQ